MAADRILIRLQEGAMSSNVHISKLCLSNFEEEEDGVVVAQYNQGDLYRPGPICTFLLYFCTMKTEVNIVCEFCFKESLYPFV